MSLPPPQVLVERELHQGTRSRTKKYPGLGRIRVRYGQPIPHAEIAGRDERELLAEIERRVRECQTMLRQHLPQKSNVAL